MPAWSMQKKRELGNEPTGFEVSYGDGFESYDGILNIEFQGKLRSGWSAFEESFCRYKNTSKSYINEDNSLKSVMSTFFKCWK